MNEVFDMVGGFALLFVDAWRVWSKNRASRMAAALAYYTMLSLAPLIVISIAIAGIAYGQAVAQSELIEHVQRAAGKEVAEIIRNLAVNASDAGSGLLAGGFSLIILLFAASGAFTQLYDTFNIIWEVPYDERSGLMYTLTQHLSAFIMVVLVGLFLFVSLVLGVIVSTIGQAVVREVNGIIVLLPIIERIVSLGLVSIVLALLYRYVPKTKTQWRDVWLAGLVTALLFDLAKYLIQFYIGRSGAVSVYGAAGSIVILLMWIYFLGQILFFGAAFSRAFAYRFGSRKDWTVT